MNARTTIAALVVFGLAGPALAETPIRTGADLMLACRADSRPQTSPCWRAVAEVVTAMDMPEQIYRLFKDAPDARWMVCPTADPKYVGYPAWGDSLGLFVLRHWQEDAPDPGRLVEMPWQNAVVEVFKNDRMTRECAVVKGAS